MKILHIVGARPNFIKVAPLMAEMAKFPDLFDQMLVHTGQHYDDNMSKVFFEDLELPAPALFLGVGSGSHAEQTARIMLAIEPIFQEHRPDWLVVVGDVNSTVACALTAAKLGIAVAHVEAGLRSFDRTMPEEINRILTDHISDLLFTTEPSGCLNLLREGIAEEKIHFTGNLMIDTLTRFLPHATRRPILSELGLSRATNGQQSVQAPGARRTPCVPYVLVTLHRPSNVDHMATFQEIMLALNELAGQLPVIFPVHPRTRRRILALGENVAWHPNLRLLEPRGYLDFLALTWHAALVITDSGGVQEETTYLGVPCLTARPNTERPVTIDIGTNRLVRSERRAIIAAATTALGADRGSPLACPELWDGRAAQRVVAELARRSAGANGEPAASGALPHIHIPALAP